MKELIAFIALSILLINAAFSQNCITKFEESEFNLPNTEGEITFLTVDAKNNKWFALKTSYQTYLGLGKYGAIDTVNFTTANSDLPSNNISSVGYEAGGNIWVATNNGLAMFDGTATTGWTIYNISNSDLPSNDVTTVAVDADNNKWLGFSNGQVAKFNGTNWTIFSDNSSGAVKDIDFDGAGNVWIAINGTTGLCSAR